MLVVTSHAEREAGGLINAPKNCVRKLDLWCFERSRITPKVLNANLRAAKVLAGPRIASDLQVHR